MRVLFDHCTPRPLRGHLHSHDVDTAAERGWAEIDNGDLLSRAEADGYQVFITTDQSIQDQQNLAGRTIAIIVLSDTNWSRIRSQSSEILEIVESISLGELREVVIHKG